MEGTGSRSILLRARLARAGVDEAEINAIDARVEQ